SGGIFLNRRSLHRRYHGADLTIGESVAELCFDRPESGRSMLTNNGTDGLHFMIGHKLVEPHLAHLDEQCQMALDRVSGEVTDPRNLVDRLAFAKKVERHLECASAVGFADPSLARAA